MKHGQRSVEEGCVGAVLMYSRAAVHTREMIIIMVPISHLAGRSRVFCPLVIQSILPLSLEFLTVLRDKGVDPML